MRSTSWEFKSHRAMKQTRLPDLSRHFSPPTTLFSNRRHSDFGLDTDTLDATMDPPACVQNAMMKQDKKPFTYTPGGIDLSEVRSPRMQRRIERNANLEGVGETPKPSPHPHHTGPLPPSALAAMRPQTQVQVFPQPPPPPPMKNIPPPPPPPSCPLPTQKVTIGDNQVLERPDMTKIIPENPMALLRRTGGPAPRPSMVEAVYQENRGPPSPPQKFQPPGIERQAPPSPPVHQAQPQQPSPPQRQFEAQSPRWQPQQQVSPPVQQSQQQFQGPSPPQRDFGGQSPRWPQNAPVQQRSPPIQTQQQRPLSQSFEPPKPSYQPPVIERQPIRQNEQQTKPNSNVGSLYIPPMNQTGQQTQRVISPPTPPQREPQVQSPGTPTLREAPRPWQSKGPQQELPQWARKEDYIENNQLPSQVAPQNASSQQKWQQQPNTQQRAVSPKPTQQPGHPNIQGHPGSFPIHIEIRASPYPTQPQEPEEKKPNAVYITQPLILQHPGQGGVQLVNPPNQSRSPQPVQSRSPQPAQNQPRQNNVYQQQQIRQTTTTKQESTNTRIIPIQIEQTPPSTPNDSGNIQVDEFYHHKIVQESSKFESNGVRVIPVQFESRFKQRPLQRQLSWGQNPTQSNKFKVIQKITQTDEDVDDDTPITQHSARFTQEMPEQFKGMKISNGDRFKQGVKRFDDENPRYRGGHIPSRIFKMLDESVPQQHQGSGGNDVYGSPAQSHEGQPQKYVHPSEQTVPEPKKYMGGNIPSRSFKILQAMTAPESCANVNNNEELPCNYPLYPHYPPCYPPTPYWFPYYPSEQSEHPKVDENILRTNNSNSKISGRNTPISSGRITPNLGGRSTPVPIIPSPIYPPPPFWGYPPPNYQESLNKSDSNQEIKIPRKNLSGRSTPLPIPPPPLYPPPFWGYPGANYQDSLPKTESESEIQTCSSTDSVPQQNMQPMNYPMYHPPYFDPYYYYYYYHGYPYCYADSDNVQSGYESSEELAKYNKNVTPKRRNSVDNSVQNIRQHFEKRCQSATPKIAVTPANYQTRPFFLNKMHDSEQTDVLKELEYKETNVKKIIPECQSPKENKVPCPSPTGDKNCYSCKIENTEALQEKLYEAVQTENKDATRNELCKLRSIKSVNNITTLQYDELSSDTDNSDTEEHSEEEEEEDFSVEESQEEEIIPHQLSIIFEESERTDSKALRPYSAMTDASTFNEHSEDDSFSEAFTISHNLTVQVTQESCSSHTTTLKVGDNFIQSFREDSETNATFTLRSPSRSPRNQSPSKMEEGFIETRTQTRKYLEENGEIIVNEQIRSNENYKIDQGKEKVNQSSVKIEEVLENTLPSIVDNRDTNDTGAVFRKEQSHQKVENSHKQEKNSVEIQDVREIDETSQNVDADVCKVVFRKKRGRQAVDSTKQDSDNEKDFWQILGKDKESPIMPRKNRSSFNNRDNYSKPKPSEIFADSPNDTKTNSTIYDDMENSPTDLSDKGRIMNMDSFVAKLEEIKRNSGLWNYDDVDFNEYSKDRKTESTVLDKQDVEESNIDKNIQEDIKENDSDGEKTEKQSDNSDESVDFWSQIKDEDDDFRPKRKSFYDTEHETQETEIHDHTVESQQNKHSSASSRHSSFSKSEASNKSDIVDERNYYQNYYNKENRVRNQSEDTSESESSSEDEFQDNKVTLIENKELSDPPEPQTIKERIEALNKSQVIKRQSLEVTEDIQVCVKSKISALESTNTPNSTSKTTSTKSSIKSFEEYSDEEVDSGVNSDLSRHISDNEEFPELKKLTRYERAATHSRLFKLLQDECEEEIFENNLENDIPVVDKFAKLSVRNRGENRLTPSRSKLNLSLNKCNEEEEMNTRPVNEKLADELVQSILKRRKGQIFRNMPKERIYAAAIKILQEDAESFDTPSEDFSSLLSPMRGDTESSTPAQTPQEFYNEYKQYYDSWNKEDDCDLIPSKAFKLLQDHISASKLGTIEGFLAKCPRILSSKNIPEDLTKLLDGNDCSSQNLSSDSQATNDVTNTS